MGVVVIVPSAATPVLSVGGAVVAASVVVTGGC